MYFINTHLNDVEEARYPEDFPMLCPRCSGEQPASFAMRKIGDDYYIQTIEVDPVKLRKMIIIGQANIETIIKTQNDNNFMHRV